MTLTYARGGLSRLLDATADAVAIPDIINTFIRDLSGRYAHSSLKGIVLGAVISVSMNTLSYLVENGYITQDSKGWQRYLGFVASVLDSFVLTMLTGLLLINFGYNHRDEMDHYDELEGTIYIVSIFFSVMATMRGCYESVDRLALRGIPSCHDRGGAVTALSRVPYIFQLSAHFKKCFEWVDVGLSISTFFSVFFPKHLNGSYFGFSPLGLSTGIACSTVLQWNHWALNAKLSKENSVAQANENNNTWLHARLVFSGFLRESFNLLSSAMYVIAAGYKRISPREQRDQTEMIAYNVALFICMFISYEKLTLKKQELGMTSLMSVSFSSMSASFVSACKDHAAAFRQANLAGLLYTSEMASDSVGPDYGSTYC